MYFDSANWQTYTPGVWQQDVFTITVEAGLTGAIGYLGTPPPHGIFPFQHEDTYRKRESTRHPGTLLAYYGLASTVGVFGYSLMSNEDFTLGSAIRGLIHTHLLTEIATSSAKNIFGRERPMYDYVKKNDPAGLRVDDRHSFFSGHAAHSYAFANYTTHLLFDNADKKWVAALYGVAAYTGASVISTTRAIDGQHHWTDVVIGGIVGFSISEFVYNRVKQFNPGIQKSSQIQNNLSLFVSSFQYEKKSGLQLELNVDI